MKCVKIDLPKELDYIEIEPLFDLHIGSKKCDYELIKQRVERIKSDPHVYGILGGDIINNSTINSVAGQDVYEEPLSPMQQIKKACDILYDCKGKLLCAVSGNHERRTLREGIDLDYWLACELGIQDNYDLASVVLFIRFGEDSKHKQRRLLYTCLCQHGSGGGGMVGSKANKLSKTGQIVNTDICIVGHTHMPITFREACYELDVQNSSVYKKETVFVNTGATLDYECYAELIGCKPSSKATPIIRLDGHKKDIRVTI